MSSDLDRRLDRFLNRFLEQERFAAALGGDEKSARNVSSALIARLFPKPVVQIKFQPDQSEKAPLQFEDAVTNGKVAFLELDPSADETLFGPLESLLKDNCLSLTKPHGRVSLACHEDFRLMICSPFGSFPFDEFVSLKLHLG